MLFLEDSYIKEFDSIVTEIIDDKIFLASTAFYAKSGGQPGDQGVFHSGSTNYQVSDTIKYEGKIAHIIQGDCNLNIGQKIAGKINWEMRYRCTYFALFFLFTLLVVKLGLKKVELILI